MANPSDPPVGSRRSLLIVATAVLVVVLDQLTKWWAVRSLQERTIPVVWTLRLNLAHNTGAAFSMGSGTGWVRFLPLIVLGVVALFIWQGQQAMSKAGSVALGMIVGGAVGNLLDRAFRTSGGAFFSGGVVDFIDFQWWPIFNVADMAVVVGGILLVLVSLRRDADRRVERASS